jgi:hypothetical protein
MSIRERRSRAGPEALAARSKTSIPLGKSFHAPEEWRAAGAGEDISGRVIFKTLKRGLP